MTVTNSLSYNEEIADRFLDLLSSGMTLREIRSVNDMPSRKTIRKWRAEIPDFNAKYELARKDSAEEIEDEILCLSADLSAKDAVPVVRAKFDILRWAASKRNAAYGSQVLPASQEPVTVIGGLPDELIGMGSQES